MKLLNMIKIAKPDEHPEIFYSIQGEGRNLGQPSIFVRTSLCNLHCCWCDTDYTWNWKGTRFEHDNDPAPGYEKFDKSKVIAEMSVEAVADSVRQFPCKNVVLTGGEPMIQQEALAQLMEALGPDYWFEIETNGTLRPADRFDALIHQYNVSPKLANSNNPKQLRERPKVYEYFAAQPKAVFKFVLTQRSELQEVLSLVERYQIPPERVYLMPEGTSAEDLVEKQAWLVEVCKAYGFFFTSRLHVWIYGDRRGV